MSGVTSCTLPNSIRRAEDQLAGRLLDPATGQPFANAANAGPHTVTLINWNQEWNDGGLQTEIGNFTSTSTPPYADEPVPGIGAVDPDTAAPNRDNLVVEVTAYLELPVGLQRQHLGARLPVELRPIDGNVDVKPDRETGLEPAGNSVPQLGAGGRAGADRVQVDSPGQPRLQ